MSQKIIIVDASNINTGGGLVLLNGLLSAESPRNFEIKFYVDDRAALSPDVKFLIKRVQASAFSRFMCKLSIAVQQIRFHRKILLLNFGNFPNPFWRRPQVTYLHNYFLVGHDWKDSVKPRARGKVQIRRWVFRILNILSASNYIVQTATMMAETRKVIGSRKCLTIMPVMNSKHLSEPAVPVSRNERSLSFCYVSLGGENKNHLNLIRAWDELAKLGLRPSLIITLEQEIDDLLYNGEVARLIAERLPHITNLGKVPAEEVKNIYSKSSVAIYPSLTESFGLGLIEAVLSGVDIIAADRKYVHDVVVPDCVFDPLDPVDIATVVMRYMVNHTKEETYVNDNRILAKLVTPREFLENCSRII